jgi:hypothetical protein
MRIAKRHQTFVGISGYGFLTGAIKCPASSSCLSANQDFYITGAYGGLDLRYSYRLTSLFEVGGGVLTGPGILGVRGLKKEAEISHGTHPEEDLDAAFVVVEPGIEFSYRPTRFFALTLGTSYRFVQAVPLIQDDAATVDPANFSATLGLQFGWL